MPTQLNLLELYSSDPPDFGATQTLDMTQPAYANTLAEYRTQHNGALIGILSDIANSSINKDEFYNRTIFNHLSLVLMSGLTPDPTDWTQQYRAILELIKTNTSASRFSGVATMPTQDTFDVSILDVSSLSNGLLLLVYFPSFNATVAPTINVSGIGPKQIKDQYGNNLSVGDLKNVWTPIIYDNGVFLANVVKESSTTVKGITRYSTDAEAQGFSNNESALTPLRLNNAFKGANQSFGANMYQRLPGGLIEQTGINIGLSSGAKSVTFPIEFPTVCVSVLLTSAATGTPTSATLEAIPTKTGFYFSNWSIGATPVRTTNNIFWLAKGY
jgi:hypothetical protein